MNLWRLISQSIRGRRLRSGLIVTFIAVLAGFMLSSTLVLRNLESSLRTGMERLGADIIVVPYHGFEPIVAKGALLTGEPVSGYWMRADNIDKIARVEGVERVSPQVYLQSQTGTPLCSAEELYIVAFDPNTDFTIQPWLKKSLNRPLGLGEVIGGDYVTSSPGDQITLDGDQLDLVGKLHPTGMWLDQTIFLSLETAKALMMEPEVSSVIPSDMPDEAISAIIVKVKPGYSIDTLAIETMLAAPATWSIRSTQLMRLLAEQRGGLLRSLFTTLGIIWGLAVGLTGLIFSLMVTERRREIGMLRAVGASRRFILRLFLTESSFLAVGGAVIGVVAGAIFVHAARSWLTSALEIEFSMPPLSGLLTWMAIILGVALLVALPALLVPAIRASRVDPAEAMREV